MRKRILLVAALLSCGVPSTASAVTIGSDLARQPDLFISCDTDSVSCYGFNTAIPGNTLGLIVPSAGVVTQWRTRVATTGGTVSLVALAPVSGGGYSARWSLSGGVATASPPNGIQTHPDGSRQYPVAAGDVLALRLTGSSDPQIGVSAPTAATRWLEFAVGDSAGRILDDSTYELAFNADVEPDADGDGYGDETEDKCPTDGSRHSGHCNVDVGVSGSATPPVIAPGERSRITVNVTNAGPSAVAPAIIWPDRTPDALVRALSVLATTGPCPLQLNVAGARCVLPLLGGGQSHTLTADVQAPTRVPGSDPTTAGTRDIVIPVHVDDQPDTNDTNTANERLLIPLRIQWADTEPGFTASGPDSIKIGRVRRNGVTVTIRASEALTGRAVLYGRRGSRRSTLGSASWRAARAGTVHVRIRVRRAKRRVMRRSTRLVVKVTGQDRVGNTLTLSDQVRLRR